MSIVLKVVIAEAILTIAAVIFCLGMGGANMGNPDFYYWGNIAGLTFFGGINVIGWTCFMSPAFVEAFK